jgi:CBS domain-containing protein
MLELRVRRVIVTDPVGRPIGVVSASDLVSAIATGVETMGE